VGAVKTNRWMSSLIAVMAGVLALGAALTAQGAAQQDPLGGNKRTLGEELAHNPKLTAKLEPLLPKGMDIETAANGFKKLDDFVSALHAAQNIGVPFVQLKARIISGDTLVKAIHFLDPTADSKAEAKKAEDQAKQELKG
jgi:hypothetical protein